MSNNKTRNQIIAAASQLFGDLGYYLTTITAIAKKSCTTKSSIYYHFKTKELLFAAVLAHEIIPIKFTLLEVIDDDQISAEEKMIFFIKHYLYLLWDDKNFKEALHVSYYFQDDFLQDFRTELVGWMRFQLQKIINQGNEEHVFKMPKQLDTFLDSFILMLNGLEISLFFQNQCKNLNPYLDVISRSVIMNIKSK